jgi:4'-phosphopantetheinyl transferase EntD
MIATIDPELQAALAALSLPKVMIGHRLISTGDENALMPREAAALANHVVKARRASGAVRIVAREFLAQLGSANGELLKDQAGAPIWPDDIVGSLAHDSRVAVAAVGRRRDIGALGIDIEPAEPLPPELLGMVTTARERRNMDLDPCRGRLHFVAKEAVYKAVYPLDPTFLEHHDVEIDFAGRKASTRTGHTVELKICISSHLVVLAFIRP